MINYLKEFLNRKIGKNEAPKTSEMREEEAGNLKENLEPELSLTQYDYQMISKWNLLATLPQSNAPFLEARLENKGRSRRRTVVGVDTPLPKHYKEMDNNNFPLTAA